MTKKLPERKTRRPNGRRRALLDTNIWRYVVDNRSQGCLLRVARDGRYDVQIAPAVLYETLRLKDAPLRATLVQLMTNSRFHRLMPEGYSESMEILQEIKRVRPDWLRDVPDLQFFNRCRNDWTRTRGGFWVKCARSPGAAAKSLSLSPHEDKMIKCAQPAYQRARKELIDSGLKRNPPLDKPLWSFDQPVSGWRGEPVEAWRIEIFESRTRQLSTQGNPYRDWLAPFVELDNGLLNSPAWVEFWLHLADKSAMPRHWMRWAHGFIQRFRKISPGSPGDNQLFPYFVETDVVITADKVLLEILEECRPYAPCHLPEGKLVPAGARGVNDLLRLLEV